VRRTFGLLAIAAALACSLPLADANQAFARAKRTHHAYDRTLPTDQTGRYIRTRLYGGEWWAGYAPHGWFGHDPTASSQVWSGPCWGDECLTYTPGFGPQRQPRPLLP
jgi:hypothetical protein